MTKAKNLMKEIQAQFGKDSIATGSDPKFVVRYLSTGVDPFDDLLQGGIPMGRFTEIYGDYSTLKSYVGLCAIREAQRQGLAAALIDTEHSFDPEWAESIGVDIEDLIIKRPENGEEAIDISEVLIRGGVDLIVFDSVAAALPQQEQTKRLNKETVQPARLAALMSLAMRKLTAANKNTAVIWINQTRMNVGVMFGSPESIPGGKALPYYASYRLAMYRSGAVKTEIPIYVPGPEGKPIKKKLKQINAVTIRALVVKSKLNAPNRETYFKFDVTEGKIDVWDYLVNLALDDGLVMTERGLWWVAGEKKKQRLSDFRGRISEEELRDLLNRPLRGKSAADNNKVGSLKRNPSAPVAPKPTRTRGRAKSNTTAATTTTSSKSRTRKKVTRSTGSTS